MQFLARVVLFEWAMMETLFRISMADFFVKEKETISSELTSTIVVDIFVFLDSKY